MEARLASTSSQGYQLQATESPTEFDTLLKLFKRAIRYALCGDGRVDEAIAKLYEFFDPPTAKRLMAVAMAQAGRVDQVAPWLRGCEPAAPLNSEHALRLLEAFVPAGQHALCDVSLMLLAFGRRLYWLPGAEKHAAIRRWVRVGDRLLESQPRLTQGQINALMYCHVESGEVDVRYLYDGLALLRRLACTGHDLAYPAPFVALMDGFSKLPSWRFCGGRNLPADRFSACMAVRELMVEVGARLHSAQQVVPLLRSCANYTGKLIDFRVPNGLASSGFQHKLEMVEKAMEFDGVSHNEETSHLALALLSVNQGEAQRFLMYWNNMYHRFPPSQVAFTLVFRSLSRSPNGARQAISAFLPRLQRDLPHLGALSDQLIDAVLVAAQHSEDPPSCGRTADFILRHVGIANLQPDQLQALAQFASSSKDFMSDLLRLQATRDSGEFVWLLVLQCYVQLGCFEDVARLFIGYLARFHPQKGVEARITFKNHYTYLSVAYNFRLADAPIPADISYFVSKIVDCLVAQRRVGHGVILYRQLVALAKPSLPFFRPNHQAPEKVYYPTRSFLNLTDAVRSHLLHHALIRADLVNPQPAIDLEASSKVVGVLATLDSSFKDTVDPESLNSPTLVIRFGRELRSQRGVQPADAHPPAEPSWVNPNPYLIPSAVY
ncbi:hypothetical protein L0F63_004914 [Massospora cicadina]|nr:hypothetical protein L0F63_004914 [Massospora cicadina]